jgi:hypothetical protein
MLSHLHPTIVFLQTTLCSIFSPCHFIHILCPCYTCFGHVKHVSGYVMCYQACHMPPSIYDMGDYKCETCFHSNFLFWSIIAKFFLL